MSGPHKGNTDHPISAIAKAWYTDEIKICENVHDHQSKSLSKCHPWVLWIYIMCSATPLTCPISDLGLFLSTKKN